MGAVYVTAIAVAHSSSELMHVLVVIFPAAENNSFLIMASKTVCERDNRSQAETKTVMWSAHIYVRWCDRMID